MKKTFLKSLLYFVCVLAAGCDVERGELPEIDIEPLAIQQKKVYPETITGNFVCLADFEDLSDSSTAHSQVENFRTDPAGGLNSCRFVVNITRTGAGAMEVTLQPDAKLVFQVPYFKDFSGYTLISMALYSGEYRDDLLVTLNGSAASWTSPRQLIKPGWNEILVDIKRLEESPDFDITAVNSLEIEFADSVESVTFNLDDVMLIDNARAITPVPPTMKLFKRGMDYELTRQGLSAPVDIKQREDGLWGFGAFQGDFQVSPDRFSLPTARRQLELLGFNRIGVVELVENNTIRIRIKNTWYFPARPGEWVSMAVRRIAWEHTFYYDGRWVTNVEFNNSGGAQVGSVRIALPRQVAWADGGISGDMIDSDFEGPVGRWSYLLAMMGKDKLNFEENYQNPAKIEMLIGDFAPGGFREDGFDVSQGCFFLRAKGGNCRFQLKPAKKSLISPVFCIEGEWQGPVSVNCEGLAIRNVVSTSNKRVLFTLPGRITRPMTVEISGRVKILAE